VVRREARNIIPQRRTDAFEDGKAGEEASPIS